MQLFKQNLLQSLRNLRHTKWQALISLIGLLVGLVSLTLSTNWLWTELNYDYFRPGYRDIYRLDGHVSGQHDSEHMTIYEARDIQAAMKGTGTDMGICRVAWGESKTTVPDKEIPAEYYSYVQIDSAMVDVLGLSPLAGSLEALFAEGDHVVLTRSVATRLFSSPEMAVGKSVCVDNFGLKYYKVVGVVEDCLGASNYYYDCLRKLVVEDFELRTDMICRNFRMMLRTPDLERTRALLPQLYRESYKTEAKDTVTLVPKALRHCHKTGWSQFSFLELTFYPLAFITISALLLLSALVNLLISFTCIVLGRMREYALRRSLGASAGQNDRWMLTELLPLGVLAVVFGAVALEWLAYKQYVPGSTDHVFVSYLWVLMAAAGALLLMLLYPIAKMRRAYRISFAGMASSSASHSYLLVVQCFCCALLLFLSLGMQRQLSTVLHADLGYETAHILRLYTGFKDSYEENIPQDYEAIVHDLPAEFRKEAGAGITDAIQMPADIFNSVTGLVGRVVTEDVLDRELKETGGDDTKRGAFYMKPENEKFGKIKYMEIPLDAVRFFHLKTRNGKGFSTEGLQPGEWPAMVNTKALECLGLDFPKEDVLHTRGCNTRYNSKNDWKKPDHFNDSRLRVQDVMDIYVNSFFQEVEPTVFIGVPERHECNSVQHDAVYIKYAPGRRADAEAAVRRVLVQKFDVDPDKIHLEDMADYIADHYDNTIHYANLLSAVTVFCVFITFAGVLSLLLYTLRLRRRSMAIRRLMGAELRDLLRDTMPPYLLYTLLGGLLAYAPAAYFMRKWMEYFYYGETPGPLFMALIVAAMLAVVFLLTFWQVRKAMNEKPVEVLRPEA